MDESLSRLINEIENLPPDWHGAGSVSPKVLCAIAAHAEGLGTIRHSVETGSGKTTLLFSHLSKDHLVFAMDWAESVSQVRRSPLFCRENVTFVEGQTQLTIPRYSFTNKVQIALIDGPHGYPFPDVEYCYLYPIIETGGLLLIDDIQIPSIRRMYEILKAEYMFELLEIVDNMAFFRRTSAALLDPLGDGWWLQGYNRAYYDEMMRGPVTIVPPEEPVSIPAAPDATEESLISQPKAATPFTLNLLRFLARLVPNALKKLIPLGLKKKIRERLLD